MNFQIAIAVGLAAVVAAILAPLVAFTPAFAATVTAEITPGSTSKTTDAFSPNPINANVGDTVTWTNKDTTIHTITSGSSGTSDGKFDSSDGGKSYLAGGQTFSHTFDAAGDYPYYCMLHPAMVGKVVVAGDGGSPQEAKVIATLDGKNYDVTSKSMTTMVTGATIQSGQSVTVMFDKDGEVELTLPKVMIDGINAVSAGGQSIAYTTTTNGDSSTIKFAAPGDSTPVVIQGASVVPEFSVILAILGATIAAIVGYTRFAKSGSGFLGRA